MATYPYPYNLSLQTNQTKTWTFVWQINGTPVNLTGYAAKMQVKFKGSEVAAATLTNNDYIALGGASGEVIVTLDVDVFSLLQDGIYEYDLLLINAGNPTPLFRGTFYLNQGVTTP